MECYFCGVKVVDVETAIDAEWHPAVWDHEEGKEVGPVCPECLARQCRWDEEYYDYEVVRPNVTITVQS